jgi:hypothetical protein
VTEYVTPPLYDVPDELMAYRPIPTTTSSTLVGAHPAPSLYRTVNVIRVDVVPDPGDAFPRLSCGFGCEAPLQLAARASRALDGAIQHATARMTAMAPIFRCSDRWAMDGGSRWREFVLVAATVGHDPAKRPWPYRRSSPVPSVRFGMAHFGRTQGHAGERGIR